MTQLTQIDTGLWYDPAQSGAGFDIRVLADGRHASTYYGGKVRGWFESHGPWLSIQGQPNVVDGSLPLLLTTGAVLGESNPLALRTVGTVTFNRMADDLIRATVTVQGNGYDDFSPRPPAVTGVFELRKLL